MLLVGEAEIFEEVDVWDDGDDGDEGKSFCNPVVAQDAPDPGVTWAKDAWYMVTTGQGPDGGAFDIRRSPDLVSWQAIGSIFPPGSHPKWSNNTDYWAPEIHHVNGRFNAYFTARNEKGVLSVGVATSDKVEGPYVDAGQPLVTDPVGTIDPTFFRDQDLDAQYVIWKVDANSVGKQTTIKIREVDDKGMAFVENSVEVDLIRSDLPWEGIVIEAPWMVKRNGEYYLFYSGNCYANERYCVGVARSASIYGPYKKAAAPILQQSAPDPSASVRKFAGPGHCSVVQGKRDMIMVYHAWRADKLGGAPGRMVMVDRIEWGADGWPIVGNSCTPTCETQPPLTSTSSVPRCLEPGRCYIIPEFGVLGAGNEFRVYSGRQAGGTVSLESVKKPGCFLRHRFGIIHLEPSDFSPLFDADASWSALPGLTSGTAASFSLRSVNYPDNWVTVRGAGLEACSIYDKSFKPAVADFLVEPKA